MRGVRASRILVGALLVLAGCAVTADDEPYYAGTPAIPDEAITPEEFLAGMEDSGEDGVEPWEGIDGDIAELAPAAVEEDTGGGLATRVDAIAACRRATGYSRGRPVSICVTRVDGKLVEYRTAAAYLRMKAAARRAGVGLVIVSGWRTMAQQRALYAAYRAGRGNLAARPGYSNHQSGLALDLNTSAAGVYNWLAAHADEYGFRRTVPSERWHWERPAGSQGGVRNANGASAPDGTCFSQTLDRPVAERTCLESRFDGQWYQCSNGRWYEGRGSRGTCSSTHPLTAGGHMLCWSTTLGRDVRSGVCLQSREDRQWYQCTDRGWALDRSLPGGGAGPAGRCTELIPLR